MGAWGLKECGVKFKGWRYITKVVQKDGCRKCEMEFEDLMGTILSNQSGQSLGKYNLDALCYITNPLYSFIRFSP